MSDVSKGPGFWEASDGKWYAPQQHPDYKPSVEQVVPPQPTATPSAVPSSSAPTQAIPQGTAKAKRSRFSRRQWYAIWAAAIVIGTIIALAAGGGSKPASTASSGTTTTTTAAPSSSTAAEPSTTTTTLSQAQIVQQYENGATAATISQLSNDPSNYNGETVIFTGTIDKFLQDSSGNTAAMNVADPNNPLAVAYVQLSSTADVTQMNTGDTVEIWGDGQGNVSGKNAFGGTVSQCAVTETYLTDQTTGYSDSSNPSPS
ncbi:MAG: hypothetical protein ABSB09_02900 [Acidimicrobiales bacterium]|jgi:hypothetical protein